MSLKYRHNLEEVQELKSIVDNVDRTLNGLSPEDGRRYVSLGIGENIIPLLMASRGWNVTGFDIDSKSLHFQKKIYWEFKDGIEKAGGSYNLFNYNFDDPLSTRTIDGFETPIGMQFGNFDCVECLNYHHKGGERDLAQLLLNFGRSKFFVSSFGGPMGKEDKIVKALEEEAKIIGMGLSILQTDLFTSNRYYRSGGVLLRVYNNL